MTCKECEREKFLMDYVKYNLGAGRGDEDRDDYIDRKILTILKLVEEFQKVQNTQSNSCEESYKRNEELEKLAKAICHYTR